MRLQTRYNETTDRGASSVEAFSLPLNHNKGQETISNRFSSSNTSLTIDSRSQLHRGHPQPTNEVQSPVIAVQYSCLLIPVFIAAWWYWTKRKARAVISGLLHHSSQEEAGVDDVPDDFSTWDEVVENESQDPSVRFVRWIKFSNSNSSAQRRASVKQASRRTLQLLTSQSDLSDSFINDDNSIPSVQRGTRGWQCLEEARGIELCAAESDGTGYGEMENLERKAWSYVRSESRNYTS